MKIFKYAWLTVAVLGSFSFVGCSWSNSETTETRIIEKKVTKQQIKEAMREEKMATLNGSNQISRTFGATGEGIAPMNTISPAQALALAKRAAMADAYRQLGAKLYGVRVNARDTVKDAALRNSRIETRVNGLIKNAAIVDTSYKDGLYRVTMELSINEARWKEIFAY